MVCGTTLLGLRGAWTMRRRAELCGELAGALGELRGELTSRLTPLPELLRNAAGRREGPVSDLFRNAARALDELGTRPFPELWRIAVAETGELLLDRESRNAVEEIGRWLGACGAQEQAKALENVEGRLRSLAEEERERSRREGRVCTAVGLAAGACAAVLLL